MRSHPGPPQSANRAPVEPDGVATDGAQGICLACALCCDGTIFRDVELSADDDHAEFRSLRLPLPRNRGTIRLAQPCAALAGCWCQVYSTRPSRCREFDCGMLKAVQAGQLSAARAAGRIQQARRLAERVRRQLRRLGDHREHGDLKGRFRSVMRRLERAPESADAAEFGELTVMWQRLSRMLERWFHPGTGLPGAE